MDDKQLKNLIHWGLFSLLISLTPLLFGGWKAIGDIPNATFNLVILKVISNGELLLICMALLAVNIGDLIKEKTEWIKSMQVLIGFSIFLSLFIALAFAEINSNETVSKEKICTTSFTFFISTVIICVSSILLPKSDKE